MEIKSTYDNCKTLITAGRLTDANILSLFLMVSLLTNDQFVELDGLLKSATATNKSTK
ncbi:MAG: hypothetical protein LKF71_07125 [Oscillospiraceae bacterium]|jgi:hypothetical protein|nr:hypothetical protein [Oscillospiraceae bacterium]